MTESTVNAASGDGLELGPADYHLYLDSLRPRIGNYDRIWKILRPIARRVGHMPYKPWAVLRRFFSEKKPYFIAETAEGIRYVGDYRDQLSITYATLPDHDSVLLQFIQKQMARTRGSYIDVGANVGVMAATMARFLEGREEVLAFEPMPDTVGRAAATFALNGHRNVRLFPVAIGDVEGSIPFYFPPGHSESASANPTDLKEMPAWKETRVPCRTLDGLHKQGYISSAGFIKLDVEGHEPKAMSGARGLISAHRPGVLFEYHHEIAPSLGWKAEDVAALLRSGGPYEFQVLHYDNSVSPFPPKDGVQETINIFGSVQEQADGDRTERDPHQSVVP
jgi:FkbM family methyltransferase